MGWRLSLLWIGTAHLLPSIWENSSIFLSRSGPLRQRGRAEKGVMRASGPVSPSAWRSAGSWSEGHREDRSSSTRTHKIWRRRSWCCSGPPTSGPTTGWQGGRFGNFRDRSSSSSSHSSCSGRANMACLPSQSPLRCASDDGLPSTGAAQRRRRHRRRRSSASKGLPHITSPRQSERRTSSTWPTDQKCSSSEESPPILRSTASGRRSTSREKVVDLSPCQPEDSQICSDQELLQGHKGQEDGCHEQVGGSAKRRSSSKPQHHGYRLSRQHSLPTPTPSEVKSPEAQPWPAHMRCSSAPTWRGNDGASSPCSAGESSSSEAGSTAKMYMDKQALALTGNSTATRHARKKKTIVDLYFETEFQRIEAAKAAAELSDAVALRAQEKFMAALNISKDSCASFDRRPTDGSEASRASTVRRLSASSLARHFAFGSSSGSFCFSSAGSFCMSFDTSAPDSDDITSTISKSNSSMSLNRLGSLGYEPQPRLYHAATIDELREDGTTPPHVSRAHSAGSFTGSDHGDPRREEVSGAVLLRMFGCVPCENAPKQQQQPADAGKYGLLYTDAAHLVVKDLPMPE